MYLINIYCNLNINNWQLYSHVFISGTTVSQWNVVTPQHLKSKISSPLRTSHSKLTLQIISIISITRDKMLIFQEKRRVVLSKQQIYNSIKISYQNCKLNA